MATDKRLDQVSQLTDFDYALIVKGADVAKVTKQQLAELVGNLLYGATDASSLASVVAGLLGNPIGGKGEYKGSADELNVSGVYACEGGATSIPSTNGYLMHYNTGRNSMPYSQLYVDWKTNKTWVRAKSNIGWSAWARLDNFGYNSLEDMANALKPLLGLS